MSEQTAQIIPFTGLSKLDVPAEKVLKGALEAKLSCAVVIGEDENGEPYFASSQANGADVIWHLELAKKRLFEEYDRLTKGE